MVRILSIRNGSVVLLWLVAASIVVMHTTMQYLVPTSGSWPRPSSVVGAPRTNRAAMCAGKLDEAAGASDGPQVHNKTMAVLATLGAVAACATVMPSKSWAFGPSGSAHDWLTGIHRTNENEQARTNGMWLALAATATAASKSKRREGSYDNSYGAQPAASTYSYKFEALPTTMPTDPGPVKSGYGGKMQEASIYSNAQQWTPNRFANSQNTYFNSMRGVTTSDGRNARSWSPNRAPLSILPVHTEQFNRRHSLSPNRLLGASTQKVQSEERGKVYDSRDPRGDLYGVRAWTPNRAEPFGTVQKAYLGKVYELPAMSGESSIYGKQAFSPTPASNRTGTVQKEYRGKFYTLPASDTFRNDGSGLLGNDVLEVGKMYESKDSDANWWPVRVEARNHDGSYTCSLVDEEHMFSQQEFWHKVWGCNCREFDSLAALTSRQQYQVSSQAIESPANVGPKVVTTAGVLFDATG